MEIRQVSTYHLFEKLGEGLSGVVYKGWDNSQQRPAAVKILRQPPSPDLTREYLSTAKALIHADHPNLCRIYEVGQTENEAYIIMELVEGMTLKDIILQRRQSDHDFLDLAVQITRGLKAIHSMKLIHGNLKPTNIIISGENAVTLLDAGLSPFKNFQQNPEFVAPYEPYHYLSPEHILNQPITPRSDLFSLGTVLYHFVSGVQPFTGKDEDALCDAILNFKPDFPGLREFGIPGDQILLIEKLLAKKPDERIYNTGELLITLKEMREYHRDTEKLHAFIKPPPSPRTYLSIAVLVVLLLVFWYVVTSFKH
ncbi:MAG: serine/threonine protein kinase [Candidatus Zixiibacteriota bacterium]|nr:MAG: serine/threonine protein kinase [candidate division Zixibacteria bacterium]